jgi:hypothetical protein
MCSPVICGKIRRIQPLPCASTAPCTGTCSFVLRNPAYADSHSSSCGGAETRRRHYIRPARRCHNALSVLGRTSRAGRSPFRRLGAELRRKFPSSATAMAGLLAATGCIPPTRVSGLEQCVACSRVHATNLPFALNRGSCWKRLIRPAFTSNAARKQPLSYGVCVTSNGTTMNGSPDVAPLTGSNLHSPSTRCISAAGGRPRRTPVFQLP